MKEGWKYKKLDDICNSVEDGDWIESKDQSPNGIRLIQTGNIGNGVYKDKQDSAKYISEETFKRLNCTEIFEGDILVSRLPDPVGRACILPDLGCRCITAVDCSILRLKKDIVCNAWISYYMQSLAYFSIIKAQCTGSTRLRITRKKLAEILIPLPSLSEQQSIVDYIDSAFAKIDAMKANAEKALNEAKALFQASLKEMLEPKEGWEEKKLEDITEVKDGTHDSPKYVTEGIPFVTQKNITINGFDLLNTKKITLEDHKKFYTRSNVEFGDIIIAMIGANRGMSCIVDTQEIFSIKNVGLIKKNDNINMRYLLFYLHSPSANTYILDNSNGGAQEFIGLKGLRTFPIPYPPLSVQRSIVETLDSLKSKVDRLQENYAKISQECAALKQAILRQVFE